jgi:hypothetical protein
MASPLGRDEVGKPSRTRQACFPNKENRGTNSKSPSHYDEPAHPRGKLTIICPLFGPYSSCPCPSTVLPFVACLLARSCKHLVGGISRRGWLKHRSTLMSSSNVDGPCRSIPRSALSWLSAKKGPFSKGTVLPHDVIPPTGAFPLFIKPKLAGVSFSLSALLPLTCGFTFVSRSGSGWSLQGAQRAPSSRSVFFVLHHLAGGRHGRDPV